MHVICPYNPWQMNLTSFLGTIRYLYVAFHMRFDNVSKRLIYVLRNLSTLIWGVSK